MAADGSKIRCSCEGRPGDDPHVRRAFDEALASLREIPLARDEFLSSILALHDQAGALRVFWKSSAALKKFARVVDRAWEQVTARPASTQHHVGTAALPPA